MTEQERQQLARRFRDQADACERTGSQLYAVLLSRLAAAIDADDRAVVGVLAGHEDDPGPSALALRLMAAVHRRVLDGDEPALAAYYPDVTAASAGPLDPDGAWTELHRVLEHAGAALHGGLQQPPQTNEVGRAAALVGGLLHIAASTGLPVRLFEIGASAGLNLNADRFALLSSDGDHLAGPADSPVRLVDAWRGRPPPRHVPLTIAERWGCDLAPIDARTPSGARSLMAYVWPDMPVRIARLRAAIEIAAAHPVTVDRLDAVQGVESLRLRDGHVSVLWHSVMWQYLDAADRSTIQRHVETLGAGSATSRRPLAHLRMEPARRAPGEPYEFLVVATVWPGGQSRVLGSAASHGIPTTWD